MTTTTLNFQGSQGGGEYLTALCYRDEGGKLVGYRKAFPYLYGGLWAYYKLDGSMEQQDHPWWVQVWIPERVLILGRDNTITVPSQLDWGTCPYATTTYTACRDVGLWSLKYPAQAWDWLQFQMGGNHDPY